VASLLRDPDRDVRPAAASALSLLGAAGADAIVTLFSDSDPKLREAAVAVLGRISGEHSKKYAFEAAKLLLDPDEGVQSIAQQTLGRFNEDGVAAISSLMESNKEPQTSLAALSALIQMMTASASDKTLKEAAAQAINDCVVSLAGDKNTAVKLLATRAIGQLLRLDFMDPRIVMDTRRLSKTLCNDPDEGVRKAAEDFSKLLPT